MIHLRKLGLRYAVPGFTSKPKERRLRSPLSPIHGARLTARRWVPPRLHAAGLPRLRRPPRANAATLSGQLPASSVRILAEAMLEGIGFARGQRWHHGGTVARSPAGTKRAIHLQVPTGCCAVSASLPCQSSRSSLRRCSRPARSPRWRCLPMAGAMVAEMPEMLASWKFLASSEGIQEITASGASSPTRVWIYSRG